jgi:DNA repair photolyase
MILNVSGRTDVVAFYINWFINRLKEGFIDVRNPFYKKMISRIYFKDVDGIVFCTKNPIPILDKLDDIKIPFIFHVTLTPYKKDVEPNVPPKGLVIEAIKKISKKIGKDRIWIRYDPVFINDEYTLEYHLKIFDRMCELLDGFVDKIIISFLDMYQNARYNMPYLRPKTLTENDYKEIGINFFNSAKNHGMTVQTCAEKRNLSEYGFKVSDCITKEIARKFTGKENFKTWAARKENVSVLAWLILENIIRASICVSIVMLTLMRQK